MTTVITRTAGNGDGKTITEAADNDDRERRCREQRAPDDGKTATAITALRQRRRDDNDSRMAMIKVATGY